MRRSLIATLAIMICWAEVASAMEAGVDFPPIRFAKESTQLTCETSPQDADLTCTAEKATYQGAAELTLLRPQVGTLAFRDVIVDKLQVTPSYDLQAAFRVWLGRESVGGMGWRATYWNLDDSARLELPGDISLSNVLRCYTVDLELTRQGAICGLGVFCSAGVRIAGIDTGLTVKTNDLLVSTRQAYTGGGLTVSLAAQQQFARSNWSVYGGFRGALLYGVTDFQARLETDLDMPLDGTPWTDLVRGAPLRVTIADQTLATWGIQLGLQYERNCSFASLFGRVGVEAQLWEVPPIALGIGDGNIGLLGPTFLVGLRR